MKKAVPSTLILSAVFLSSFGSFNTLYAVGAILNYDSCALYCYRKIYNCTALGDCPYDNGELAKATKNNDPNLSAIQDTYLENCKTTEKANENCI